MVDSSMLKFTKNDTTKKQRRQNFTELDAAIKIPNAVKV